MGIEKYKSLLSNLTQLLTTSAAEKPRNVEKVHDHCGGCSNRNLYLFICIHDLNV